MTQEYTPAWSNPRMTKAQMRKYLRDMQQVQEAAKKKLDPKKEAHEKHHEVKSIEEKLDDVF